MKYSLLILDFHFIVIPVFSQDRTIKYDSIQKLSYKTDSKDTIYFDPPPPNVVIMDRIRPVFVGNKEYFIKENLMYPEEARKRKLEGYVNIYCQIDSVGVPANLMILYATSPLFEREAERIVRLMRWKWDQKEPFKQYWSDYIKIVFKL